MNILQSVTSHKSSRPTDTFQAISQILEYFKGCRMGCSDKVTLWYVALLINTRFRFFILE